MAGKDEEIDVIENALLVYNNQLKMFDYIINDKHRTPTKKYFQRNYLNQDRHHHHYQYDLCYKKLLLKE